MGELKNRERMNITLSNSMAAKLRQHCEEMGYNISGVIESALRDYFAEPDAIKYEVLADMITIQTDKTEWTTTEIEAAYFDQDQLNETSLGIFDTMEEARAWAEKCKAKQHTYVLDGPQGKIIQANVLYVQEGVYTADFYMVQAKDILEFYAEPTI